MNNNLRKPMECGDSLGPYRLAEAIGEGGMGVVWKAHDTRLERTVAIKFVSPRALDQEGFRDMLLREARSAAALQHPNICSVYEVDETYPYLVMEFVEGQTLKTRISGRPLPFREALGIAAAIAAGLQAAHNKGIIHRDLKPANILLNFQGQAKITDFGLARLTDNSTVTRHGDIGGTPAYMAPEQFQGGRPDRRSDIWALGVVLYEMLTGRIPAAGLLEPLPPAVDRIVRKCLAPSPADRYQNVDDVIVDLQSIADGVAPRRRYRLTAAAVIVTVLAAGVTFSLNYRNSRRPPVPRTSSANLAADAAFLRGKFLASRDDKEQQQQGLRLLEQAVESDPAFAAGHAALARAYINHYFIANPSSRQELEPKAYAAVEKALSLDPVLSEAYLARALLVWTPANGFPHERAIRDMRHAIRISPSAEARRIMARMYYHNGLAERGLEEALKSATLDSNLAEVNYSDLSHRAEAALCLASMGRHREALEHWSKFSANVMHPFNALNMAWSVVVLGELPEAHAIIDKLSSRVSPRDEHLATARAILYAAEGKKQHAVQHIELALSKESEFAGHFHHITFFAACVYARLGYTDNALRWLKYTAETGFPNVAAFETAPDLKSVRNDPRYQALLTRWKAHSAVINAIE